MATYQKVLKKLNVESAEAFKESIKTGSSFYMFTANCRPTTVITTPIDSKNSDIDTFNNILFGNKIKDSNVKLMANRHSWSSNTVYDIYDPTDTELNTKAFYVDVNDGLNYNVYKCLDNNNNSPSTVQPFGTDNEPFYSVVDGYVWKYLYTIDDSTYRIFASNDYIPVDDTQNGAYTSSLGGIEVITIDANSRGIGYNNYTVGSFDSSASIEYNNIANQYLLNSSASMSDSFYVGCLMKVTSLATGISDYRKIVDYYIDSGNRVAVLDSNFSVSLSAGDLYEIYPNIVIQDLFNTSTESCVARAIISANSGNSVSRIEIITPGSGYKKVLGYVDSHPSAGVISEAIITPIVSPSYGHGSNLNQELFAYRVCMSTTFTGNTGVLLTDNGYGTIGIIKNPKFSNVNVMIDTGTLIGAFHAGEKVYRYKSYTLSGNVSVTSGNSIIVSDSTTFGQSLRTSDRVIITNGQQNLFANVESIINDTTIMLDQQLYFTYSNCSVEVVESSLFGTVSKYDFNDVLSLTDVSPSSLDSVTSKFLGNDSNSTASVNSAAMPYILIGDRSADEFNQFVQLTKLFGTIQTDTFVNSETIAQGNTLSAGAPTATLFSVKNISGINNDVLYVTNTINNFEMESTITGQTSGGIFTYQYKYDGELVKNSGDIVYLENLNYITRSDNQSETVKIILEF